MEPPMPAHRREDPDILAALDTVQRGPSLTERAIPMAMRVGGAIVGGIAGLPAGPPGVMALSAGGAGLGEIAAQDYERSHGLREDLNPTQVAVQTGLGAIPMGRAFGSTVPRIMASRSAQGGLLGGGATVATELAETGELPTAGHVALGAGLGATLGGTIGAVEGRAAARMRPLTPEEAARTPVAALPPGATFQVAPDGSVAPVGVDIRMTQAPDGSFVRGVPAEYARREVAGLLPAGREAIPMPGEVAADPSFVRGVPAQYARREVRGELPAGPRFVAGPSGAVARAEDADQILSVLARVQRQGPDVSGGRAVPAAVLERDIDVTRPTSEAIRVRQYSSEVGTTDAPLLSEADTGMLRRMRADLEEFTPQRGRLITDPNDPTSSIYAHGTRGSYVGEDIRVISEQRVGNDKIAKAIDDLLEGKAPTNRLHLAAIDAARGYAEGRPGYRGPILPMELTATTGGGGGSASALDDFAAFSRIFDDVEPGTMSGVREPGQEGFISAALIPHLGGGVAGASYGAATGEDTDDRLGRAVLFGAAGAAAPSLLLRRGAASAPARDASGRFTNPPRVTGAPPPRSGRSGTPITEPMRGMAPFLAKFSNPLVRTGIERVIADNGGFAVQRRGVIDTKHLDRFAAEVRVNVSKSLPKGTALNAEAITAYARGLQETQRKVNELAAVVNSAKATDTDVLALQAARAEAEVLARSLLGARAEAGRALGAFNFYRGILETGDVTLIRDALKAPGLRDEAEKLARGLAKLPNDPIVRYKWLQQQGRSTLMNKVRSYYYANILSGVKTHERNVLGNVANVVSNLAVPPLAAGIDALKSVATGAPRTVRLDELPAQMAGAVAGFERGIHDFAFTMRHGVSPHALTRSVGAAEVGKFDVPRVEFTGGAANPFNWPGRTLDAADVFFRSIARNQELYGMAHTQATREGLKGQPFLHRVAELRAGLTPDALALHQQAEAFATRTVFQETPGFIASAVQSVARRYPVFSFVVPFVKTPANITRQGLEFSPAGVLMKAAKQEGRAGRQAQARAVAGSAAAAALAYYAAAGRLSGTGPRDPAKRAALMESGWRPNSVRIGDQWVSYQLFQPVSVQAAVIANAFEAWAEKGANADDAPGLIASTLARSANSFLDQSFMSGLFDFVEALKDPEFSGPRLGARVASGFIPLTSAVRTVQQARDPVVRRPQGFKENIQAGIPGRSEQLPARIDRFGDVVTREGGPVRRAADPFNVSGAVDDPVAREIDRLGVNLSLPSNRLELPDGRRLTGHQEQALQQARGRAVRAALERAMGQRSYQRGSDLMRRGMIDHAVSRARRQVSDQARRELVGSRRAR
jgi:hypothetical protein